MTNFEVLEEFREEKTRQALGIKILSTHAFKALSSSTRKRSQTISRAEQVGMGSGRQVGADPFE